MTGRDELREEYLKIREESRAKYARIDEALNVYRKERPETRNDALVSESSYKEIETIVLQDIVTIERKKKERENAIKEAEIREEKSVFEDISTIISEVAALETDPSGIKMKVLVPRRSQFEEPLIARGAQRYLSVIYPGCKVIILWVVDVVDFTNPENEVIQKIKELSDKSIFGVQFK